MDGDLPFRSFRFQPLDLSSSPDPPNWLVDDLFAMGDVTMLESAEGRGKSWITMALAVAVAEGKKTFLGKNLHHHGAVVYGDEENPLDVIRTRLQKLGLPADNRNLVYLWNQGIQLDEEAEHFVAYCRTIQPKLVVLDSLTRFHDQDENNAGAMAKLFNRGIQPLARELGAAVILIHHQNATGGVRGSTDIKASIDARLTVGPMDSKGRFLIQQNKTRRSKLDPIGTWAMIEDLPDGSVHLRADILADPVF